MNMKKKLLAIAVASATAGVVTAPTAALAAGPTLYGQGHVSIDYLDNDDDNEIQASSNSSRIGVKGSQDLGNGLTAIYLMEWGVNMTDTGGSGANTLSARNRYIGLKSDAFGTLVAGRHDTPMKVIGRKVDLFWSTQLGQNRTFTNIKDGGAGYDLRADNVIGYISPNFGPVHVFAAYVADHNLTPQDSAISDDNDQDAWSAVLIYDQNGLFLAGGYERHNADDLPTAATGTGSEDNESAIRVTGKYNLGDFTVSGLYQKMMDSGFNDGNDRTVAGGGLAYKMGANTFKGQVYWADESDEGPGDDGGWLYSLGVDHNFTKTVAVYVQGAYLDSDDNSTIALGGSGHGSSAAPSSAGDAVWGVSTGMRIKF